MTGHLHLHLAKHDWRPGPECLPGFDEGLAPKRRCRCPAARLPSRARLRRLGFADSPTQARWDFMMDGFKLNKSMPELVKVAIVFSLGLWGTEARVSCGSLESCSLCVRGDGCGKARSVPSADKSNICASEQSRVCEHALKYRTFHIEYHRKPSTTLWGMFLANGEGVLVAHGILDVCSLD